MSNKKLSVIIAACVFAVVIIVTGIFAYAYQSVNKNSIGLAKAINIALADAGVSEENATLTKAERDFEKNTFVYEIEFVNDSGEFEYTIKTSDGTILKKNKSDFINEAWSVSAEADSNEAVNPQNSSEDESSEAVSTTEKAKSEATSNSSKTTAAAGEISLEDAKNIAMKNAGVAQNDVTFTSAHKDRDNGIECYDIEFSTAEYKYEYEIDLKGTIISFDKDPVKINNKSESNTSANAKYIGVDSAKNIALKSSSLSESDVVFTKAKLERDDGIYIYEIEFKTSSAKYEYEIDAVSGRIFDQSIKTIK